MGNADRRERVLADALDAVVDGSLPWEPPAGASDVHWDGALRVLLEALTMQWRRSVELDGELPAPADDAAAILRVAAAAWGASGDPGPSSAAALDRLVERVARIEPAAVVGDPLLRFGCYVAVESLMAHARLDLAVRLADRLGDRLWDDLLLDGRPHRFAHVLVACRTRVLAFSGRIAEAAAVLDAAPAPEPGLTSALLAATACLVRGHDADQEQVRAMVAEVDRHVVDARTHLQAGVQMLSAFGLIALGELEVREAARRVLIAGGDADLSRLNVIDRALALEMLVALAVAEQDRDAAEAWAQRIAPLVVSPIADSTVFRTFSRVALLAGRPDEAVAWAERGVRRAEECGRFIEYAEGEIVLNRARLQASPSGRDEAVAALEEMVRASERLGLSASRRAATRELRPAGLRLRPLSGSGWALLSPREAEVARAVAHGGTNREIARRLHVSEHTVRAHVSRVLAAFGVATRSGLPAALGAVDDVTHRPALTTRQEEVADLVAQGLPNRAIGVRLGVSPRTVEKHVGDILVRWDLSRRTDIARVVSAWADRHQG